jgi:integrase
MKVFPLARTNDNPSLSPEDGGAGCGWAPLRVQLSAGSPQYTEAVANYLRSTVSHNTERAYRSDVREFLRWGGVIPSSAEEVAHYLASEAERLSPFTLERRLVAIGHAHRACGAVSPCGQSLIRETLRGIRRVHGKAQRRVEPLLRDDLIKICGLIPDGSRGTRDKALLLLGFAGAFRRSELSAMTVQDVRAVPEGLIVMVPRSKTDQEGVGRTVAIPRAQSAFCPAKAYEVWIELSGIRTGKVFRTVGQEGAILDRAVNGGAIAKIVKHYAALVGLDPVLFSGHSLRAGLVTSAAKAGVSGWKICQQTGHKTDAMVHRYIRDADIFTGNAAGALL